MPKVPGLFNKFKGTWVRGDINDVPPDHLSFSLNQAFKSAGMQTRPGTVLFLDQANIIRTALYKPLPPFTGTNTPRQIYLKSNGTLYDSNYPTTPLFTNVNMTDFGFVNFFGRCYISPSDGRVGLDGEFIYVYDGTGPGNGFRKAAGTKPVTPLGISLHLPLGGGNSGVGTYLFSYALETSSGFITRPATPFVAVDAFGSCYFDVTNLPLGPAGITAARWIIATKVIPFRADLTIPFDVTTADFYPQFFAVRIADNTTTTTTLNFYDENLIESSDYLLTLDDELDAGVGLIDYKGRMVSYGEHDSPSVVRISTIGEPESFSTTSGFLIVDPSDSTGVRCATEFRNLLYFYKQQRGYMTQDNGDDPSTWDVVNFEKSIGTEQYGIAAVLDAKGSSSEGYLLASRGAIVYFNGVFVEPELTYKIRDLWSRVNPTYFYKMQLANDPINRYLYALIPLDQANTCDYLIFGDYRDGLDPMNIKWSIWRFAKPPVSILIYNEFVNEVPSLVTRLANNTNIVTIIDGIFTDNGEAIDSNFWLAPLRFSNGISQFNRVRIKANGPCRLSIIAQGLDQEVTFPAVDLSILATPGREFTVPINLVSEECTLNVRCNVLGQRYNIDSIQVEGFPLWDERVG